MWGTVSSFNHQESLEAALCEEVFHVEEAINLPFSAIMSQEFS
jgi:hypothetical protein